uniref:Endothelin-converting enzyme 1-like isoform X2 n=1 Tax=Octopus vulgaris TaxID=6645 RepID=A0A6C0PNJ3_OCTVU|nr:endothelin-converting enzyme 1-like isoform X2 [Octopus vulgaris]
MIHNGWLDRQTEEDDESASNEENELLSAGAIKMSERPFSRSESRTTDSDDDDLMEDYDVTIFNPQCVRNRSALEKFLAVILVLFLVVIIALAVALVRSKEPPDDPYCSSPECISAAGSILTAMDTTVDPCHDFYQYTCGNWVRDNPIPENYASWDRFQELSEKNLYRLKGLLENLQLIGPLEQKVKNFYNSCLLESDGFKQDIRKKTLDSLKKLIHKVGGWSFKNATNSTILYPEWTFESVLLEIHLLDIWPLFRITVDVDEMDLSRNIFKIGIGSNFLDSHRHPLSSNQGNETSLHGQLYAQYLKESFDRYLKETIRIMELFIGKSVNVSKMAYEVSIMEKTLVQMKSLTATESYNVSTIHDLLIRYPAINWIKYFQSLATIRNIKIQNSDRVAILYPDYLSHLSVFLNDVKSNITKAETLQNYLIVTLMRSMLPFFQESNLEEDEKDSRKPLDNWKRCIFYTNKALGFATGAIYVKAATKGREIHDKIENLIKYIKEAFKAYILRKFWMDKYTKAAAAAKLDSMIEKVSYPSFMLNTTFLNNYYKQFDVLESSWFTNLISWKKFDLEKMIAQLIEKPDRRRWISPPVTVSPFYSPIRNELFFPMALFHLPFFSEEGPQSLNFGAIGSVIGHEITHAFGIRGMHYDGNGQLRNWWNPDTAKKFNITTQCVRKTYSSYQVDHLYVDGEVTLDENIADNGGLRAAYVAYLLWTEENGIEKPLPGLDLTPTQLFYVSFAQMYCSAWTKEGLKHHLLTDHFAPGKARVIGAISNSRAFSSVFDCPFTSAMNPSTKCEVW